MPSSILDTIQADFDSYSKSSKAVAQVILDAPARVLSMSIVELAELADVSDPTVLRFARKLGFTGYKDFKRALSEEMTPGAATIALPVNLDHEGYLGRIVSNYTQDFNDIMGTVDETAFSAAVDALTQATEVEFWGQCTSSTLAMDAYDKFFRAGIACVVSTEPNQQRIYTRGFGEGDVIVAISHLGHNEDIARSLQQATALGATTISIATEGSLVATSSSISITTAAMPETLFSEMNMKAAHVFIVDALAIATTVAKAGGDFQIAGE